MNELQMKIIFYKKKLNLTNDDICASTNLPPTTISRICSGKTTNPKLGTLRSLANVFGCTLDDLMGLEGGVEPYYLDKQTGAIALEIKENAEFKKLLHIAKDLSSDDLQTLIGIINMIQKK